MADKGIPHWAVYLMLFLFIFVFALLPCFILLGHHFYAKHKAAKAGAGPTIGTSRPPALKPLSPASAPPSASSSLSSLSSSSSS